ncbi:hypothetical protein EGI26_10560 [Lacihabitans sp. CCS-44]|nr:hypothetical protein [Lacihabitans sp. CCS-44]
MIFLKEDASRTNLLSPNLFNYSNSTKLEKIRIVPFQYKIYDCFICILSFSKNPPRVKIKSILKTIVTFYPMLALFIYVWYYFNIFMASCEELSNMSFQVIDTYSICSVHLQHQRFSRTVDLFKYKNKI